MVEGLWARDDASQTLIAVASGPEVLVAATGAGVAATTLVVTAQYAQRWRPNKFCTGLLAFTPDPTAATAAEGATPGVTAA